jgi:hypothetical protein
MRARDWRHSLGGGVTGAVKVSSVAVAAAAAVVAGAVPLVVSSSNCFGRTVLNYTKNSKKCQARHMVRRTHATQEQGDATGEIEGVNVVEPLGAVAAAKDAEVAAAGDHRRMSPSLGGHVAVNAHHRPSVCSYRQFRDVRSCAM